MKSSQFTKVPGTLLTPDSLQVNFLGYTNDIRITSRQLIDLNTKLCFHGAWEMNEADKTLKNK